MMSRPERKLVHLFNCDRTYKLDAVEGLLNATKAKLDFEPVVEKHYFSLSQMSEMTTKVIPELQMDMAFFVVHAHESRLSINEDNAGIGYAKIYRALLEATHSVGGNVIIIIGGDDNYKNKDEEDRVVISRWAKMKIQSQFKEEFLDGRESFIFSWNKKHREIHEEALLHYFNPKKKEQKFEYQPKPKQLEIVKAADTSSERAPEEKVSEAAEQKRRDSVVRSRSDDETREQSPFRHPTDIAEQTTEDHSFGSTTGTATATLGSEHGAKSKETPSASAGGITSTELAILGCNVSSDSMQAVSKVFEDIRRKLNLAPNPPVENFVSPLEVKQYLTDNHLTFCTLVVDAKTVKDAYDQRPRWKLEYKELLETAAKEVYKKVILLICDTCSLESKEDEVMVSEAIERIICDKGKGFVTWLKKGKLCVDPGVLVQFLVSKWPVPQPDPQTNPSRGFQETTSYVPGSAQSDPPQRNPSKSEPGDGYLLPYMQQPSPHVSVNQGQPMYVKLRSLLRYGIISLKLEDLQLWDPEFRVPDKLTQRLFRQYQRTPVTGVTIVQCADGTLKWSVDSHLVDVSRFRYRGVQIANNERLQLKTRVYKGVISFDESDVHFRFGNWEIPQYIVESLEAEYCTTPCGELYIVSDEKENLRCIVKVLGKFDRIRTSVNKREFKR